MQKDALYCNINIKGLPNGTQVESYLNINWNEAQEDIEKTVAVWSSMDLLADRRDTLTHIRKHFTIPANGAVTVADIEGAAIVHGVRFRGMIQEDWPSVAMQVFADKHAEPLVHSSLDHGFGSRAQRTLALGQSEDGWRCCCLPMPFKDRGRVQLLSSACKPISIEAELFIEESAELPDDVMFLRSYANEGRFRSGVDKFENPDLPLADFFYENGYRALDHQGRGHVVAYLDLFDCQPELDEHVYIDDERTFPDNIWNGTGHEDLFDMAWGHVPQSSPMTSGGSQRFEEVNVRLFWNLPLTFTTAIRFNWEWAYKFGVEPPRDARFASTVYWYE